MDLILAAVIGFLIGALLLGLWAWTRIKNATEQAKTTISNEQVVLQTKVEIYQKSEQEYKEEQEFLRSRLEEENVLRAKAEAQAHRVSLMEEEVYLLQKEVAALSTQKAQFQAELQAERQKNREQSNTLEQIEERFRTTFQALSAEALQKNNSSFLELAKVSLEKFQERSQTDLEKREQAISHLVLPMQQALEKVDSKLHQIEKERFGAYESLKQQISSLVDTGEQLRVQTANLVQSLRSPTVRGRWGEIQLRRVVEMAGMVEYCDFIEQTSTRGEEKRFRPDLIVRLPGKKQIIIDAKAPLEAYLRAIETNDDSQKKLFFSEHANQVRNHIKLLSAKAYWEQFDYTPEFVVMFLPGEAFFSAALQDDPALIEIGVTQNIILATPTTLIALLRSVAYGWKQEYVAERAQEISKLGRELFQRLHKLGEHFQMLGKSLTSSVKAYNDALGSLESRVFVTARKLKELQVAPDGVEVEELMPIESSFRLIESLEEAK